MYAIHTLSENNTCMLLRVDKTRMRLTVDKIAELLRTLKMGKIA